MSNIGFIGASGLMGHGMAKNLLAKGHALALTVHRNRERVADLLTAGAKQADSPKALAATSDVVFICVTGSPQVEAVVQGPDGLLAGAKPGLTIIDCSTSEPDSTARLRELCARSEVAFVDPPLARPPVAAGRSVPTIVGEAVHQSLALAGALGHGRKFVPSLVEAQEQLSGARLVPRS